MTMKRQTAAWVSKALGREMFMRIYGDRGKPMLVFSCQGGRCVEFEDFGMVDLVREYINDGLLQVFTIDSHDSQSWAADYLSPPERLKQHELFESYVINEVLPFIRTKNPHPRLKCMTYGASMGGYHAGNFFFRHPQHFDAMISLSGVFRLRLFIGDYMDKDIYFHSPLHYLPNLNDAKYLDAYRRSCIIICVGQGAWEGPMLEDARAMDSVFKTKNVPAWVDIWGHDVNHDWPWWRKQLPYFMGHLKEKGVLPAR